MYSLGTHLVSELLVGSFVQQVFNGTELAVERSFDQRGAMQLSAHNQTQSVTAPTLRVNAPGHSRRGNPQVQHHLCLWALRLRVPAGYRAEQQ